MLIKSELPFPKASRSLDAWIAENVMGWIRFGDPGGAVVLVPPDFHELRGQVEPIANHFYAHSSLPHFSTNLHDAWSAVQHALSSSCRDEDRHAAVTTL